MVDRSGRGEEESRKRLARLGNREGQEILGIRGGV